MKLAGFMTRIVEDTTHEIWAKDVGAGVLMFTICRLGAQSPDTMVFVPGVMLRGDEIVTKEGLAPSDVPGVTMHDRVAELQRHVADLKASNKCLVEVHARELQRLKDAHSVEMCERGTALEQANRNIDRLEAELATERAKHAANGLSLAPKETGWLSRWGR